MTEREKAERLAGELLRDATDQYPLRGIIDDATFDANREGYMSGLARAARRPYTIRPATREDSRFIYNLSMSPEVRENSTRTTAFSFEQHERWFEEKLTNGLNAIFVMEVGGVPVGQVRYGRCVEQYDRFPFVGLTRTAAEIAISVSPTEHRRGYAKTLLTETMPLAREWLGVTTLVALVLRHNRASRALFRGAGFRFVGAEGRMGKCHARYEHVR